MLGKIDIFCFHQTHSIRLDIGLTFLFELNCKITLASLKKAEILIVIIPNPQNREKNDILTKFSLPYLRLKMSTYVSFYDF